MMLPCYRVYCGARGYAVLTEYRLAKLGVVNAFTICGTPEYLAPEQVNSACDTAGHDEYVVIN